MQKTPFLLVVGDKEMVNETVSVRARGGEDLGELSLKEFMDLLSKKIKTKE